MDAADFKVRIWWTGTWVRAALLGAVLPVIAFWELLAERCDFDGEPPWSWVTISIVPLASSILLFLPTSRLPLALVSARAMLIVHATIMVGMLAVGLWTYAAGWSLFLDLLLIAAISVRSQERLRPLGPYAQSTIVWLAALFGLGLPIALAHGFFVLWRAEAIAGDRPYCIQYASQTDAFAYEPARTMFDLSALKMQQRLGTAGFTGTQFISQHPAVLIVDDGTPSFFRWSYSQEDFLDEYSTPRVFCNPARHYGRSLAIWTPSPTRFGTTIAGHRLSIPAAYRPCKEGQALIIDAVSPDFAPYAQTYDRHKLRYWQHSYDVRIVDANSVDLSELFDKRTANATSTESLPPQSSLKVTQLFRGNIRTSQILTASDDAGHITDLIHCEWNSIPTEPHCRYWLTDADLSFYLLVDDRSPWQEIKQNLMMLLASFEPSGPH
jgi:hypothetical protein